MFTRRKCVTGRSIGLIRLCAHPRARAGARSPEDQAPVGYSDLNAVDGSTRVLRRAGNQHASIATTMRNSAMGAIAHGL